MCQVSLLVSSWHSEDILTGSHFTREGFPWRPDQFSGSHYQPGGINMNLKLFMSLGTIVAGLICSAGNAQASNFAKDRTTLQPFEIAQMTDTGNTGGGPMSGSSGSGVPRASTDPGMPGGPRDTGITSGNMDPGKTRQGGEMGMGSDMGKGGQPGSSSTGSSRSSGMSSGSGSSGVGGTSGGTSGGAGGGK